MEDIKLRKVMGGYKKDDVIGYIDSLVKKYEGQIAAANEEQSKAQAENQALTKENAQLFEKVRALEEERDSVSRAVISAQREAENILADAREKGRRIVAEKEQEAAETENRLADIRSEIRRLRLGAAAALRKYEREMHDIVPQTEDDDE